ncbi:MAG: 16S rRNA (guanine(966)-N(2))-methyltransferase RsmD [Kofleriaceae bacterium]
MRIVGGPLGGRRLRAPAGAATRPTSDKVREAIFQILGPPPADAHVLDLFAGSGALAAEALARGAASAELIDAARPAIAAIRANLTELGLLARARVVQGDALRVLAERRPEGPRWRWVFVDPPYQSDLAARALLALGAPHPALADDAIVVVEHDRRHQPPARVGCLLRTDHRRYGDTEVSFFHADPSAQAGSSPQAMSP